MLSFIFNREAKLNTRLHAGIVKNDVNEVREALRRGASPTRCAKGMTRSPLVCAIRYNTSLSVIDALLNAGADPQEPYEAGGRELTLADAARMKGRSEDIIDRLLRAEREAEARLGPRPLFKGSKVCFRPKFEA